MNASLADLLSQIAHELAQTDDPLRAMPTIVSAVRSAVDGAYAVFVPVADSELAWVWSSADGEEPDSTVADLLQAALRSDNAPRRDHAERPLVMMPVTHRGRALGTLCAAGVPEADPFTSDDGAVVRLLADQAAVAIAMGQSRAVAAARRADLEDRNQQLAALSDAAIAISSELSLERVLQEIVDAARGLVRARYAALGVPNADGSLDAFIHSGMSDDEVGQIAHFPTGLGLLGAITQSNRPIRLASMGDDVRSVGFPDNHPPMTSFLGAPILAADRVIGTLYFTDKEDDQPFNAADEELVVMFAAHASVALQNARLYEQVEQLAVLDERTRIGMDLHDGIIQSIYAMGLVLESTKLVLPPEAEEAHRLLNMAVGGLNDAIKDIRNFIMDLRPRRFRGDLGQGIAQLVREFQANTLVPVELQINAAELSNLPPVVGRAAFLTTQEALANIARHAKASQVDVTITRGNEHIVLAIDDDGRGFDMEDKSRRVGHGLANMQARAEELNGRFYVRSMPGEGTTVTLRLPVVQNSARTRRLGNGGTLRDGI